MSETPFIDSMLDRPAAAAWLRISERDLAEKSLGRKATIPAFRPSRKIIRYNPRTIIAAMARQAGVPTDVVAASFGITEQKGTP